jgi:hypothetical protein
MAARGLVYGVVGLIALEVAWGHPAGDRASKDGAIAAVAERPLGRLLLLVLAAGFGGYVIWRTCEALWGTPDEDDDKGPTVAVKRATSAGKAMVYVALIATTVRVIASGPSSTSSDDDQPKHLTARALDLPGGRLLVIAAGVLLLVGGAYFVVRGVAQRFEDRLDTSEMGRWTGRFVDLVGTLGMAARGSIVGLLGLLVLKAAIDRDPSKAAGVDEALRRLAQAPYGQALLTVVAIGIVAFGCYSFAEARFRESPGRRSSQQSR